MTNHNPLRRALPAASLLLALAPATALPATLWTGPATNFTQSATSLTDELIPGAVSLTRAYSQWLYNPDGGDQGPGTGTPTDTEWAFGTLDNYQGLAYAPFASYRNGDLSSLLIGNPMVVHLINEDVYLSLTFSQWPQHGGFFAYTRSTPAASGPPPILLTADGVTNGQFYLSWSATPGSNYVLAASSDLVAWTPLATNTATNATMQFTQTLSTNQARFYRVALTGQ
jgi:hypothetical protein